MYPYDFQNKTWKEIAHYIEKAALLFLPIGSTEAHGPHLPLSTDTIISVEMSRRAANLLAQQKRLALVLPPISYSVTDFSANFPGSISISAQTATSLITDLCCSLINQGFK
ncbi:MAG: creatininase family protein, partial [Blastocatellia bacterium]|nr:creatininase family protein [Blastocatellia bacterium]